MVCLKFSCLMHTSLIIFNINDSFLKCNFFHHRMNKAANLDVIIKTGKNQRKKVNNSKIEPTMKLIHSSASTKSALVYIYPFQDGYSKDWSPIQKFSMDKKYNFSETRIYFPRVEKNFRRAGKL